MSEFDSIVIKNKINITQSITSRIKQTLSSTHHTMSMLSDFKKKKKCRAKIFMAKF